MQRFMFLSVVLLAACGVPSRPARPSEAWLEPHLFTSPAWEGERSSPDEPVELHCDLLDPWDRRTVPQSERPCPEILDAWTCPRVH